MCEDLFKILVKLSQSILYLVKIRQICRVQNALGPVSYCF